MAKQTFTTGQILTAAQMTSLQQTALGGGSTTAKTTSYTLVAADAGTVVQMNSASATTITVNTGLFAAGDTVQIQNVGSGVCTVTAGTATVNTSSTLSLKQYDAGSLYFNSASAALFFAADAADSPLTTKGDLFTYSTAPARLAVGNDGEQIVADSSTSTGLRYSATPSASNPIINSAFQIAQRGTSIATVANTSAYTLDRWQVRTVAVNMANTVARQNTSDTTNLPSIQYCARVQRNSGQTGTSLLILEQGLETVNSIPFTGKVVTLSFYARAGANFSATSNALTSSLINGTGTDQMPGTYTGGNSQTQTNTLTTTWQRFSQTVTVPTNSTEIGTMFYYSTTGTAGTNDYFEVTGVQIDIGSVALPFRTYAATIQGELAACQRYYYRIANGQAYSVFGTGAGSSATVIRVAIPTHTTMRVYPTSVDYSGVTAWDYAGGAITFTSLALANLANNPDNPQIDITGSGITTHRPYYLLANNNANAYVGLSAEL